MISFFSLEINKKVAIEEVGVTGTGKMHWSVWPFIPKEKVCTMSS